MKDDLESKARSVLTLLTTLGDAKAISTIQSMLLPHVMRIFTHHDHTELQHMILTDYDLVRKQTPEGVKNVLENVDPGPDLREQWEETIVTNVTPENIVKWLRNPEEWLDDEDAEVQRAELRKCAEVIEETPGGEAWLEAQVLDLYEMAGIVPEDSTRVSAND